MIGGNLEKLKSLHRMPGREESTKALRWEERMGSF